MIIYDDYCNEHKIILLFINVSRGCYMASAHGASLPGGIQAQYSKLIEFTAKEPQRFSIRQKIGTQNSSSLFPF
jgi:hypothetical protein